MSFLKPLLASVSCSILKFEQMHFFQRCGKKYEIMVESILPNFGIFIFPIFAFMLGYFKVQTIFFMLQTLKLKDKNGKSLSFKKKKG
jgi:hypothetical protein